MFKTRKAHFALLLAVLTATSSIYLTAPNAAADVCEPLDHLVGSTFEIDRDSDGADLEADDAVNCIDWLVGSDVRGVKQEDAPSGGADDSFGEGTSEDDPVPTAGSGSIPPNKSDLSWFGVNTETGAGGQQFLQLFWSRVQNPKGTTNMDFELNKNGCFPPGETDGCSANGLTPERTDGDKLITYELSKGGTVPVISILDWDDTTKNWTDRTVLSDNDGQAPGPNCADGVLTDCAVGSVNRTTIPANKANGIGPNGLDPFTFGEASISFAALFPEGTCGGFGSAYLKSRSSDSFTAALKDFIAPKQVNINNCPAPIRTAQFVVPQDTATVGEPDLPATGQVTFSLYEDTDCLPGGRVYTETVTLDADGQASTNNDPAQGGFAVTKDNDEITYKWIVEYGGDGNYEKSSTACGAETFHVTIAE